MSIAQRNNVLSPAQVMYYLGLDAAVRSLFLDDTFTAERLKGCTTGHGTMRGSAEYHSLNDRTGGKLEELGAGAGLWEFGTDGFQPFKRKAHTSDILITR